MIYFTSDTHFGHKNIIEYTNRPFSSGKEMDEALIRNWNGVVTPDDLIYHLGDFTLGSFEQAQSYLSQLNGKICVLGYPWHHDGRWLRDALRMEKTGHNLCSKSGIPVSLLSPIVVLERKEYAEVDRAKPIVLCHYPFSAWDRKHYNSWHLHGHSHGCHRAKGLILDVGVDCHDFHPVSLEQVAEYMGKLRSS